MWRFLFLNLAHIVLIHVVLASIIFYSNDIPFYSHLTCINQLNFWCSFSYWSYYRWYFDLLICNFLCGHIAYLGTYLVGLKHLFLRNCPYYFSEYLSNFSISFSASLILLWVKRDLYIYPTCFIKYDFQVFALVSWNNYIDFFRIYNCENIVF